MVYLYGAGAQNVLKRKLGRRKKVKKVFKKVLTKLYLYCIL